ncbi:MAG: redoxin domain-containing protein [Chloroflexota bacterium]
MPNPLTGDLHAVLQVSGSTLNRLIATMHQNAQSKLNVSRVRTHAFVRIGDELSGPRINGVVGTARAQIGVPRLELFHGEDSKFAVSLALRLWYTPDGGSTPLPEHIWGRLRIVYRVAPAQLAELNDTLAALKFDADPNDVSFQSFGDSTMDAAITTQLAHLATERYRLSPHPLSSSFAARQFRSLVGGSESGVLVPLAPTPAPNAGQLASVTSLFLGGKDFALAISREFIMSQIEQLLQSIRTSTAPFPVTISDIFGITSTTYTIRVPVASATWSPGTITLDVSGSATSPAWWAPDARISARVVLRWGFNAATEALTLTSDPPVISLRVSGPLGWLIRALALNPVRDLISSRIANALTSIQPHLDAVSAQKATLISQLVTLDPQVGATIETADFGADGVILRGSISVSPPQVSIPRFTKLADRTGFSAYASSIPGGTIERYHWRWWFRPSWSATALGPPDGDVTFTDRFELAPGTALPGLPPPIDGPKPKYASGIVCLSYQGHRTDRVSGADEPVETPPEFGERICRFVAPDPLPPFKGGLARFYTKPQRWWQMYTAAGSSAAAGRHLTALVSADEGGNIQSTNALILYLGDTSRLPELQHLSACVEQAARPDAGVLTVLLLRPGLLDSLSRDETGLIERFVSATHGTVAITEDIGRGWSGPLGIEPESAVAAAIADATGELTWRANRAVSAQDLVEALRRGLSASEQPVFDFATCGAQAGQQAPHAILRMSDGSMTTLRALRKTQVHLAFVRHDSWPSRALLARLARVHHRLTLRGITVIAIAGDASHHEADELRRSMELPFAVLADVTGLAVAFGVRIWPTALTITEDGTVANESYGADPGALQALDRQERSAT